MNESIINNEQFLFMWCGKPNTELSREELLEIVQFQSEKIESMRIEHLHELELII